MHRIYKISTMSQLISWLGLASFFPSWPSGPIPCSLLVASWWFPLVPAARGGKRGSQLPWLPDSLLVAPLYCHSPFLLFTLLINIWGNLPFTNPSV